MDLVKINSIVSAFNKLRTISIRMFSGNNVKIEHHTHVHNGPVINIQTLDEKTKRELKVLIGKAFIENKAEILRLETEKPLELIGSGSEKYGSILTFFKEKLSVEHFSILRVAVAVRYAHDAGDKTNVNIMKHQAILSYGEKAANVCNLCTAGYFESFLIPLYESYSKKFAGPDLANSYLKAYVDIVDNEPFTVFVSRQMSMSEVKNEILEKLSTFTKYGASRLYIHGIGDDNIVSIRSTLVEIKSILESMNFGKSENQIDSIIKVELFRKSS